MKTDQSDARPRRAGALPKPIALALWPFESVWFGVTLLTVLLVYMSVGSALPPVRESRLFEMTEFQWFHTPAFAVMVILLTLNITVVTIRKIPFNVIKLGVWMIHTGIVAMILSTWWYFAAKVEGDAPVIRRNVSVTTPAGEAALMPALPGAAAEAGDYSFRVAAVDPVWPILSGEDAGEEAFSVSVMVTPPEGAPFIRQMLAGYPQYTEDVLPDRGRAVRETGEKFVDHDLVMSLELAPQEWFHLAQTRAVFLREIDPATGEPGEWAELPVDRLPRYNDYVADPKKELWLAGGDPVPPSSPLDVPIPGAEDAIGIEARATGFVRYAGLSDRIIRSGAGGAPAVVVGLTNPEGRERVVQLSPDIETFRTSHDDLIAAVRLDSPEDVENLLDRSRPTVTLSAAGDTAVARVDRTSTDDPTLGFAPIGDSGYAYRVRLVADGLTMPDGSTLSSAIVELRAPSGDEFVRIVSDREGGLIQDLETEANGGSLRETVDENVEVVYTAGDPPATLTIALGPDYESDAAVLLSSTGTAPTLIPAAKGETISLPGGGSVRVLEQYGSARLETRPSIVPKRQRDRSAGEFYSMLRVAIDGQQRWIPFHEYVFDGPSYKYQGKFRYEPARFELSDGRVVEAIYSRERERLPSRVVLEDFHLRAHVGGFTGAAPSIRDWISDVRFETESGEWSELVEIRTNKPATWGDLSFFQARWDPPPSELGPGANVQSGGFAFTGLGVGNRAGVNAMLASSSISVLGMLYVFYVKPSIQRARLRKALEASAASQAAAEARDQTPQDSRETPVEVGA